MPYAPGAFPALILLTALYVSKTVGDGCHCPHLQWLLQLLLQEHLEGRVVGGLEGCKNALSTTTTDTWLDSRLPSAAFCVKSGAG